MNDGIKFNDFQLAFSDLIKDEDAHSSLDASLLLIDNQIKAYWSLAASQFSLTAE